MKTNNEYTKEELFTVTAVHYNDGQTLYSISHEREDGTSWGSGMHNEVDLLIEVLKLIGKIDKSKSNEEIVNLKEWWELQSIIDAIQCGRPVAKPDKDFLENLATAITNAKDAQREKAVKEERERKIDEYGFYDLVNIAKAMLTAKYPLDVFDGSSGNAGPVFTSRLHHAMEALTPNISNDK